MLTQGNNLVNDDRNIMGEYLLFARHNSDYGTLGRGTWM